MKYTPVFFFKVFLIVAGSWGPIHLLERARKAISPIVDERVLAIVNKGKLKIDNQDNVVELTDVESINYKSMTNGMEREGFINYMMKSEIKNMQE